MSEEFKILDCIGAKLIADAISFCPSKFCDFTPFVILMWQEMYQTEYILTDSELFLRLTLDEKIHYAISSDNIEKSLDKLFKITGLNSLSLSLIKEEDIDLIKKHFSLNDLYTNEAWWDYIYKGEDLSTFSGKRFSGQRNHINKFKESYPDWSYEEIDINNLTEVRDFYDEITKDVEGLSDSALFEMNMVKSYLREGYRCFPTKGGLVRAGGKIVSFAFGEIIGDVLCVHIEKARRDVQGAYQMIVKEFASHNPSLYINREEDMGIEGLKRSKESYHPIEKIKKYTGSVTK